MARRPQIGDPISAVIITLVLVAVAAPVVAYAPFTGMIVLLVLLFVTVAWLDRRGWTESAGPSQGEGEEIIESLLQRDVVADEINYMEGHEFEKYMADFLRRQGYAVEETPQSGDQGIDLILPDYHGKRVVVQLKRWTRPVGNDAIQATFAGRAYYRADEGWIITTSSFTRKARELARRTRVRLIDGKELSDWLEEQGE